MSAKRAPRECPRPAIFNPKTIETTTSREKVTETSPIQTQTHTLTPPPTLSGMANNANSPSRSHTPQARKRRRRHDIEEEEFESDPSSGESECSIKLSSTDRTKFYTKGKLHEENELGHYEGSYHVNNTHVRGAEHPLSRQ